MSTPCSPLPILHRPNTGLQRAEHKANSSTYACVSSTHLYRCGEARKSMLKSWSQYEDLARGFCAVGMYALDAFRDKQS